MVPALHAKRMAQKQRTELRNETPIMCICMHLRNANNIFIILIRIAFVFARKINKHLCSLQIHRLIPYHLAMLYSIQSTRVLLLILVLLLLLLSWLRYNLECHLSIRFYPLISSPCWVRFMHSSTQKRESSSHLTNRTEWYGMMCSALLYNIFKSINNCETYSNSYRSVESYFVCVWCVAWLRIRPPEVAVWNLIKKCWSIRFDCSQNQQRIFNKRLTRLPSIWHLQSTEW